MIKQVIIFRNDLRIGKGKIAAHAGHAAIVGYQIVKKKNPTIIEEWLATGQKKVILKIENEKELLSLFEKIRKEIPCEIIRDAGLTQVEEGTIICLVIGPWHEEKIDKFTKDLKLL